MSQLIPGARVRRLSTTIDKEWEGARILWLIDDYCCHCHLPYRDHADGKCLFEPTSYEVGVGRNAGVELINVSGVRITFTLRRFLELFEVEP